MNDALVRTRKEGRIGWITLHRPEAMNTFTLPFADQLDQALRTMEDDPEVTVVIVEGAGKNFCTGIALEQSRRGRSASTASSCSASTRSTGLWRACGP